MRRVTFALVLITALSAGIFAGGQSVTDIITDVRAAIAAKDFARGETLLNEYRTARGATPELIEAMSWLARGTFAAGQLDLAAQYSADTHDLAVAALRTRRLDEDAHLQIALAAAIETDALVRAARGDRSSAVYFLQRELETYRDSSIHKRIQKNINLLSLEGQPAPPLESSEFLGPPGSGFDQLKGKVVLLFFWAHWCPDCKAQGPIIAKLLDKYRARGLRVVAPTQRFGYIVAGQDAPADAELRHIVEVRDEYYAFLRDEPVPVSDANHKRYGVSSTPTLALVDRQGIVRVYHPGGMTEQELEAAIQKLL
jgi:thiol-disulfide isomerase/thioredoxin